MQSCFLCFVVFSALVYWASSCFNLWAFKIWIQSGFGKAREDTQQVRIPSNFVPRQVGTELCIICVWMILSVQRDTWVMNQVSGMLKPKILHLVWNVISSRKKKWICHIDNFGNLKWMCIRLERDIIGGQLRSWN